MSFGFQVWNSAGVLTFDMSAKGCLFVEAFAVPATGGNVSRTYPSLAGRTIFVGPVRQSETYGGNQASNMGLAQCDVQNGATPSVVATPGGAPTIVYVFAG